MVYVVSLDNIVVNTPKKGLYARVLKIQKKLEIGSLTDVEDNRVAYYLIRLDNVLWRPAFRSSADAADGTLVPWHNQ